ncbi:MAG: SsrA-binding protein SmpB [Fusobacteria bacterium]|nr:SsrA-binding protein SmpB [Fusobacteriota bacterium]
MILASNKKAYFDYFILEKYEAGIELKGSEVKSIKAGKVSIKESYVRIMKNEIVIINMNVTKYDYMKLYEIDEKRTRKLLLHRREINKLSGKVAQGGFTIVPLSVYIKNGLVKIEIALAKGKKIYDKREELAKKTQKRDVERALKEFK